MSRRLEWIVALAALAGLILFRAWPLLWWPGIHFDSDQAIVGLMARHISEGRAFPLYFYGQSYMLAVEAWLAAPLMALSGATVAAVKAPLVAINLLTVGLLVRVLVVEVGLRPALAAVAALPLALPAAGVGTRVIEANGGNAEMWLYVVVLWMLRSRWWAFGLVLGFATAHREFSLYGAIVIFLLDAVWGVSRAPGPDGTSAPGLAARWAIIAVAALAVRAVIDSLEPFASALGPGTHGNDRLMAGITLDPIGARVCFAPDRWASRAQLLIGEHLPQLVGGLPGWLQDYGLVTGVPTGFRGLAPLVAVMTLGGVASGWIRPRPQRTLFGWYLVLVGLLSTAVYGFAVCSPILIDTLRYNLLGLMTPVGALVLGLSRPAGSWRSAAARGGFIAVVALWCALNAWDYGALAGEYLRRPPTDQRGALAAALERRGITTAWAHYRFAYHLTFLTGERVRVSANDYIRVQAYAEEAAAARAGTIVTRPCDGGDELIPGIWLCP